MRHVLRNGWLAAAAGIALAAAPAWALDSAPTWETPLAITGPGMTNTTDHSGANRILAYDHYGNAGIAVRAKSPGWDNPILYEQVPGLGWSATFPDGFGSEGKYPSLAYDRYERPALSYVDGGENALRYAAWTGSAWSVTDVALVASGSVAGTSLAFDLYGNPAIAYRTMGGSIQFSRRSSGGGWATETVATGTHQYSSLVFDALNRPMIAYADTVNNYLTLAVKNRDVWQTIPVTTSRALEPSLAIDPDNGYPAVAYLDTITMGLRYAAWDGTAWQVESLTAPGVSDPSLAFDPADGRPCIAYSYFLSPTIELRLAWHDGAAWQTSTAATGVTGCPSLAFNDYGTGWPAIAYIGADNGVWFVEDPPVTPEPATLAMLLAGGGLLVLRRLRGGR